MKRNYLKKVLIVYLYLIGGIHLLQAGEIQGKLSGHKEQKIQLIGFDYFKELTLGEIIVDGEGKFLLQYPKNYRGIAKLTTPQGELTFLYLAGQNIVISGDRLSTIKDTYFQGNDKNIQFLRYITQKQFRMRSLRAWRYLEQSYSEHVHSDSYGVETLKRIKNEICSLEDLDEILLNSKLFNSYLQWFLPLYNLILDMPEAIYTKDKGKKLIEQFRKINFKDSRFKESGILKQLIKEHFKQLEITHSSLEEAYVQMNKSSAYLIENLKEEEVLLNTVAELLFDLFEQRSLFKASEYLSLKMLSEEQCKIEKKLQNKFEGYRTLKVGNKAPEIVLNNSEKLTRLSEIVIVAFGVSWCNYCQEDIEQLKKFYGKWKGEYGVEVLSVSLDSDKDTYQQYFGSLPWKTYCDFEGWESKPVKDFHIYATPTYYILNKEGIIQLKPSSVKQIDAWLDANI